MVFVEGLLYISIGCRVFGWQLGVLQFERLSGLIVLLCGLATIAIMVIKHDRLPQSFWFLVLILLFASISEFNAAGGQMLEGVAYKDLLFAASWTVMACYASRGEGASIRFAFFLAISVFVAVAVGQSYAGVGGRTLYARMALKGQNVASAFANSNTLALTCYTSAITLLFYTLRSGKLMSAISICMAAALAVIDLKTLSRQGLIMLAFGLIMYFLAVFIHRKGKTGFLMLGLLTVCAAYSYVAEYTTLKGAYEYRLGKSSTRTEYFATAVQDMGNTLVLGKGSARPYTAEGIQPHFTFLYIHLAFGGLCAWSYAAWMMFLIWKAGPMIVRRGPRVDSRIEIATFFCLLLAAQFPSPFAPLDYANMLALGVLERNMLARKATKTGYDEARPDRVLDEIGNAQPA